MILLLRFYYAMALNKLSTRQCLQPADQAMRYVRTINTGLSVHISAGKE